MSPVCDLKRIVFMSLFTLFTFYHIQPSFYKDFRLEWSNSPPKTGGEMLHKLFLTHLPGFILSEGLGTSVKRQRKILRFCEVEGKLNVVGEAPILVPF